MGLFKTYQRLSILADEAFAVSLLKVERVKRARAMVDLYSEDRTFMCLNAACLRPVHGEIFAHCEQHMTTVERSVKDTVESEQSRPVDDGPVHPFTSAAREILKIATLERIADFAAQKTEALKNARLLVAQTDAETEERRAWLHYSMR